MSGGQEVPPQGPGDRAHGIPSGYGHSLQSVYLFFITQLPAPPSTGTAVLLRYHMGCRLWVSGTVVSYTTSGASRAAGSGRPGPGSAPAGPALTGPALAAVGTSAKTHLSWGCPPQTHPPAQEARVQAAVRLQSSFKLATGRLQEACELLVSLGSGAKPCLIPPRQRCT